MATTVRLPEALQTEATDYASRELGLSLNGLIAVALREYLDRRRPGQLRPAGDAAAQRSEAVASAAAVAGGGQGQRASEASPVALTGDGGGAVERSDAAEAQPAAVWSRLKDGRCSCGSGRRYDKCHGRGGRVSAGAHGAAS